MSELTGGGWLTIATLGFSYLCCRRQGQGTALGFCREVAMGKPQIHVESLAGEGEKARCSKDLGGCIAGGMQLACDFMPRIGY